MAPAAVRHADLYHTGIVVDDIDAAKEELAATLGVTWGPQGESEQPVLLEDGPGKVLFQFAYTAEGPHHLELVGVLPGTLWTVTSPGHAHHVGYWCDDVAATSAALTAQGLPRVAKVGTASEDDPAPIVLHRTRSGLYVELVDRSMKVLLFGTTA